MHTKLAAAVLAAVLGAAPLGALAQSGDSQETITGSIASIEDADSLTVNDDRGYVDNIHLTNGAIITPRGVPLAPGMKVRIAGRNGGRSFEASSIEIANQAAQLPPQPQAVPPQAPPQHYADAPVRPPRDTQPPLPDQLPMQFATAGDFTGQLDTALDSKSAFVGQSVRLLNVTSGDRSISGATLLGTITEVDRPGQGKNAQIEMHFDRLQLRNGPAYHVDGVVASVQVSTKNNALKEAGGALAGMLAGNAIAKTLFGISGGGIIGAVGGFLIAKDNRADVVIPQNTAVTVRLLRARRQAS
jgi:hypothetical protein